MKNGPETTNSYLSCTAYPLAKLLFTTGGHPFFRVMIEQQLSNSSVFTAIENISKQGKKAFFYGLAPSVVKEGQRSFIQMFTVKHADNWSTDLLAQFAPSYSDSGAAKGLISGGIIAGCDWLIGTPISRYTLFASSQGSPVTIWDFSRQVYQQQQTKSVRKQISGILNEAYRAGSVNFTKQLVSATTMFWTNSAAHHSLDCYQPAHPYAVACTTTLGPAFAATLITIPFEVIKTRMQNTTGISESIWQQFKDLLHNPRQAVKGILPKFIIAAMGNTLTVIYLKHCKALQKENATQESSKENIDSQVGLLGFIMKNITLSADTIPLELEKVFFPPYKSQMLSRLIQEDVCIKRPNSSNENTPSKLSNR